MFANVLENLLLNTQLIITRKKRLNHKVVNLNLVILIDLQSSNEDI